MMSKLPVLANGQGKLINMVVYTIFAFQMERALNALVEKLQMIEIKFPKSHQ
jgi:hypothetical protein